MSGIKDDWQILLYFSDQNLKRYNIGKLYSTSSFSVI